MQETWWKYFFYNHRTCSERYDRHEITLRELVFKKILKNSKQSICFITTESGQVEDMKLLLGNFFLKRYAWILKPCAPYLKTLCKNFKQSISFIPQNLDKWKMNRRKRNEDVLERVIEVKKFENSDTNTDKRKAKTLSQMRDGWVIN